MWWISPSLVVVWGNSVFAYHWSLQTGIGRFSGFWSNFSLESCGWQRTFSSFKSPCFQENGWRIFDRDLIKGEGLSPKKKSGLDLSQGFFSPQRIYVTLENVWSRKGDIPRFCPTQVFRLMLWSCMQTNGMRSPTCPSISPKKTLQLSGNTAKKKHYMSDATKKNMQKKTVLCFICKMWGAKNKS